MYEMIPEEEVARLADEIMLLCRLPSGLSLINYPRHTINGRTACGVRPDVLIEAVRLRRPQVLTMAMFVVDTVSCLEYLSNAVDDMSTAQVENRRPTMEANMLIQELLSPPPPEEEEEEVEELSLELEEDDDATEVHLGEPIEPQARP